MTVYRNAERDKHQHAIIGSSNLAQNGEGGYGGNHETKMLDKELKQRNFADELKRQIEERDFLRKKEEWRKTRAAHFA